MTLLREKLGHKRIRLNDAQRRRLAMQPLSSGMPWEAADMTVTNIFAWFTTPGANPMGSARMKRGTPALFSGNGGFFIIHRSDKCNRNNSMRVSETKRSGVPLWCPDGTARRWLPNLVENPAGRIVEIAKKQSAAPCIANLRLLLALIDVMNYEKSSECREKPSAEQAPLFGRRSRSQSLLPRRLNGDERT
jgi:hypothetical protein